MNLWDGMSFKSIGFFHISNNHSSAADLPSDVLQVPNLQGALDPRPVSPDAVMAEEW